MGKKQYESYKKSRAQRILKILNQSINEGQERTSVDYIQNGLGGSISKKEIYNTLQELEKYRKIKKTYFSKKKFPSERRLYITLTDRGRKYVKYKKKQAKEYEERVREDGNI